MNAGDTDAQVEKPCQDGTCKKYEGRRVAIGDGEDGKDQRTNDKAKLYGARDVCQEVVIQVEIVGDISDDGIAGKPQGSAKELGDNDDWKNSFHVQADGLWVK